MKMTTLILLIFLMVSPAFRGDAAKGATTPRKCCAECHDSAGLDLNTRHLVNLASFKP